MVGDADRLMKKLERGVSKRIAAFGLEANRQLRLNPPLGTPVQDGNARGNWILSIGAAGHDTGEAAAAAGVAQVAAYSLGQGDLYLYNRTPYIKRLNNGWSAQSPALFVEAAIERAKTKIREMGGDVGGIGVSAGMAAQDVAGEMAGNLASAYSPFGGD